MNRKDLKSLMEAYEGVVLDKEFSPEEDEIDVTDNIPNTDIELDVNDDDDMDGDDDINVSHEDMVDNEEQKFKMVSAHLHGIRSHAHEIHSCVENGANIEPWMEEKIALANDYVVKVANAIMYRK
jgi:hypothetical protein